MAATLRKLLISEGKFNIKCPHKMTPNSITVHNTANDASAENEIKYMTRNNNQVSFHIAVDDKEAVQGIPLDRNAWHAGDRNGNGNRKSIAIEICYSKSGGTRFDKAERNAAELIAGMLKERGWGVDRVKKHQDWSEKYCPHRTLDMGWQRFLNMVKEEMGGENTQSKPDTSKPSGNTYTGGSLVDYLKSVGKDSSFSARKKYAAQYGIKNYEGTAKQNTTLLNKMRKGASSGSASTTAYYKKYTGNSVQVDVVFKEIGVPEKYRGKWNKRKPVATKNGISNYTGTGAQNTKLVSLSKTGKLKKV